jgi:hypothetical protein
LRENRIPTLALSYEAPLPFPLAPSLGGIGKRRRAATVFTDRPAEPLPCEAEIIALRGGSERTPEAQQGSRAEPLGPQHATFIEVDPNMSYGEFLGAVLQTFDFRFRSFLIAETWTHRAGCTPTESREPAPEMR